MPRPPMRSTPPDPAPDTICRSPESVALATFHPSPTSPTRCSSGTSGVIEEHLVEVDVAGDVAQRAHVDTGLVQVEQEVRDALALRHVGIGAREQHAEVGDVRPGRPHLLAGDDATCRRRVPPDVASDARSEPAPGSLNSWHHTSSLRTMRGRKRSRCSSVPCAKSAGAARFRPSGFKRPRLNGAQLLFDRTRDSQVSGRGRRTRRATWARRARTRRTPGTTPRTRHGFAPRESRRHRPRDRRRSTHAARSPRSTRAPRRRRRRRGVSRRSSSDVVTAHRPWNFGGRALLERGEPLAEVVGARRELQRERLVRELLFERRCRALVQQPLRQPERHRRARARAGSTTSSTASAEHAGGDGTVDRAPLGRFGAGERRGRAATSSRARTIADPPRQQPRRAAVGGEARVRRTAPRTVRRRPRS